MSIKIAARQQATQPAGPAQSFAAFTPSSISALRDGGTIIVAGTLNRSVLATVRYDGGFASADQGKIFARTKLCNGGAGPERRMSVNEMRQMRTALLAYMKAHPAESPMLYEALVTHLARASGDRGFRTKDVVTVTGTVVQRAPAPALGGESPPSGRFLFLDEPIIVDGKLVKEILLDYGFSQTGAGKHVELRGRVEVRTFEGVESGDGEYVALSAVSRGPAT